MQLLGGLGTAAGRFSPHLAVEGEGRGRGNMLRFEWNALRVGDLVLVHDPEGRFPAASGTVVAVDTKRERRGANGVGIRVGAEGGPDIVWPSSWRFTMRSEERRVGKECRSRW